MSKQVFANLMELLEPYLIKKDTNFKKCVAVSTKILSCIRLLAGATF